MRQRATLAREERGELDEVAVAGMLATPRLEVDREDVAEAADADVLLVRNDLERKRLVRLMRSVRPRTTRSGSCGARDILARPSSSSSRATSGASRSGEPLGFERSARAIGRV